MSDNSRIEWTEATWNVITGCTKVSDGCEHCYIERTPPFRMAGKRFDKPGIGGTTSVTLHPERLTAPLRWRKPRRVFVNSLADLFHDDIDDDYIARVFAIMSGGHHIYQVLTKRHARMKSLLSSPDFRALVAANRNTLYWKIPGEMAWPLPNVWLGVSVENQQWADIRIPALLETPAAVRWLSCEPLLGPVDLVPWLPRQFEQQQGGYWLYGTDPHGADKRWVAGQAIGWCVVGGESGPGARPMHPDWVRSLRDQCTTAGVPYFFKQWGEWKPAPSNYGPDVPERARNATQLVFATPSDIDGQIVLRSGKKLAGRELDGRTWDEYPAGAS